MGFGNMPGYISEFSPVGDTSQEFIEIALPEGTDPSGYSIQIYDGSGNFLYSYPLGTPTNTMAGHDVYVVDSTTPGYSDGGNDPTGRLYPDDAVALVDGDGNVLQFLSYLGNTVTATNGDASGQTSTETGSPGAGESLQSDDGGSTYYVQSSPNSGSIPACYAPGTLIATPGGHKPVETLRAGDLVLTAEGHARPVRWVWSGDQPLEGAEPHQKPILIRAGTFGVNLPSRDLIVSGQHRIAVGSHGQLEDVFEMPCFVPAKALCTLPGIRFMNGKKSMKWHHFLCDDHSIALANGLASETLLLAPMVVGRMSKSQHAEISAALQRRVTALTCDHPALPCLTVGETRDRLKTVEIPGRTAIGNTCKSAAHRPH